jgi:hypothetical protein
VPAEASAIDSGRRGRLLRAIAVVAVLVVLVVVVVLQGRGRFAGRVQEGGKATHIAYPGERLELVLEDRERAGTRYEAVYRQRGLVRRFQGRTGGKSRPSRIAVPDPGRSSLATVTWRADGRTVARWSVSVKRPGERRPR